METKKAERSPYTRPLRIAGWGTVLFFLAVLLFSIYQPAGLSDRANHVVGWISVGVIAAAILGAALLGQKGAMWKAKHSYRVDLVDGAIVRESRDGSKVVIPLKEVQQVYERHGWLLVEGRNASCRIAVPSDAPGFANMRQEVSSLFEIKPLRARFSPQDFFLFGIYISAFVLLLFAHAKVIVILAADILVVIQGLSMYRIRRVFQKRAQRWIFLFTYFLFFFCMVLVTYQRIHSWR